MSLADEMLSVLCILKEMQTYYDNLVKQYGTAQVSAIMALSERDNTRPRLHELTEKLYATMLRCPKTQGSIRFFIYVDWYVYDHLNWSFRKSLVPSYNQFSTTYPEVTGYVFEFRKADDPDDRKLEEFAKLVNKPTAAKLLLFKLSI